MTLRVRLLFTSLAVAVPLAALLYLINDRLRLADMRERLGQFARAELATGILERCQAGEGLIGRPPGPPAGRGRGFELPAGPPPRGSGGRGREPADDAPPPPRSPADERPYDLYSYGSDFTPSSPDAPPLDAELRAALAVNDSVTAAYSTRNLHIDGTGLQQALWMQRDDPHCAVLLMQMRPRPGERRDQIAALALVTFSAMLAAWLAAGPVISRMRKLTDAVRRSADTRYETPVPADGGDEVASLGAAFNDAAARVRGHLLELQHREDGLRQFVANTAHDVGLPLTVLQGHLAQIETLVRAEGKGPRAPLDVARGGLSDSRRPEVKGSNFPSNLSDDGDMAARTHVRAAIQEAHYLGSLIRNLNAATRLDAVGTPLARHAVDLSALIERVAGRHRAVARAAQVELNYAVPETPVSALAEATLLEQAVSNLVDNAVRHNRPGGHVAVLLDAAETGFRIMVTDDGPGVKDDDIARLTERWFRADDARTRRPDGQGLGLAIAAEAVKRLGFTLTFSRPPDGGLGAEIRG